MKGGNEEESGHKGREEEQDQKDKEQQRRGRGDSMKETRGEENGDRTGWQTAADQGRAEKGHGGPADADGKKSALQKEKP